MMFHVLTSKPSQLCLFSTTLASRTRDMLLLQRHVVASHSWVFSSQCPPNATVSANASFMNTLVNVPLLWWH
jgi:hypothetical protein